MAEKLDWLMLIVFEFIDFFMKDQNGEDTCFGEIEKSTSTASERDQLEGKFFKVFLNLFCEQVLITHQSKYVQFIIFYLCSLRMPFQKAFLNQLMDNITKKNPLLYKSTQLNSIYYLGSYLARAKYVDKQTISTIFNYLLNHLTSYLAKFDEQTKEDTYNESLHKIHQNLYHLLQAMLYIMCFRFNAVSDKDILQKFHKILRKACSDFNALYFISPSIQSVFLDVCESFGATEFIDLFETSQEIVKQSVFKNHTQIIDTYFPFDPYCLQYSDKYICEIYQNWQEFNVGDYESLDSSSQRKSDDSKLPINQQSFLKPSQNNLNNSFILSQTPNLDPINGNCNTNRLLKDNYGFNIDKLNNINEFEYDKDNMIQEIEDEVDSTKTRTKEKHKQKKQQEKKDQQQQEEEESYSLESQIKAAQQKDQASQKISKKDQRNNQISTTDNSVNTTPIIQANNEEDNMNQHLVQSQQTAKKHKHKQNEHHKDNSKNIQQQEKEDNSFSNRSNGQHPTKKQKKS